MYYLSLLFSSFAFSFILRASFAGRRAELIGVHCVSMRVYPDADQGAVLGKAAWPVLIVFEGGGCCHPIYSGRQACGRTSRGHTGGRLHRISHPPSFCGACLNFSRGKDSAVPEF